MAELLLPNGSMQPVHPRGSSRWTISELESLVRGDLALLRASNGHLLVTNSRAQLDTALLGINRRASNLWRDGDTLRGNVVMVRSAWELPNIPLADPGANDVVTWGQLQAALAAMQSLIQEQLTGFVPNSWILLPDGTDINSGVIPGAGFYFINNGVVNGPDTAPSTHAGVSELGGIRYFHSYDDPSGAIYFSVWSQVGGEQGWRPWVVLPGVYTYHASPDLNDLTSTTTFILDSIGANGPAFITDSTSSLLEVFNGPGPIIFQRLVCPVDPNHYNSTFHRVYNGAWAPWFETVALDGNGDLFVRGTIHAQDIVFDVVPALEPLTRRRPGRSLIEEVNTLRHKIETLEQKINDDTLMQEVIREVVTTRHTLETLEQKIHDDTLSMLMMVPLRQDVTNEIAAAMAQLRKELGL